MATMIEIDLLDSPALRRSSLRDIKAAVRRGHLDADTRSRLLAALDRLSSDSTLRQVEAVRILRILSALGEHQRAKDRR
jgi:hypothetical protein